MNINNYTAVYWYARNCKRSEVILKGRDRGQRIRGRDKDQGTRDKGQGIRDKGQRTRHKGRGTEDKT